MQFTVNGQHVEATFDLRTSLLDLLRDHLGLTGSKKGCNQGACGACTVLVDGDADQFLPGARRPVSGTLDHDGRRAER